MKKQKTTVMDVSAAAPRPDWRGALTLAIILSGPFFLVLFGIEFAVLWVL